MPTGSGKTAVMMVAGIHLRASRALVVAPSRLLREQLSRDFETTDVLRRINALEAAAPLPVVVENKQRIATADDWEKFRTADVVVTTPFAASPGIHGIPAPPEDLFDLVVFDEGHHRPAPTYQALADAFPNAKQILFTATPFRRDEREISGDLVFTYDLAQARRDGVFGRLRYVPVSTGSTDRKDVDDAIARAAAAQLATDRAAGLQHVLLVRAASRDRAQELAAVYAACTTLKIQQLHSGMSQRTIKTAVASLRSGDLDAVIAVDMLGEGFDLPNLKVAALHAPHRSLAITLQFIGRFARTGGTGLGEATFFAAPHEIEGEAARLYAPGAEWNEIVEDLSRQQISAERDTREFMKTFVPDGADDEDETDESDSAQGTTALSILRTMRPYFHVKAYEIVGTVDLTADLGVPKSIEPVVVSRSAKHSAVVWIGRQVSPVRWSGSEQWSDVRHDLFIVAYVEEHRLLFICSSRRENAVYDALIESVVTDGYRRLAPNEINRVLRDVKSPEFFSVGMRNRAAMGGAGAESYRMLAGRSADRAIRAADGELYDQGHAFCRGVEGEDLVTIGFSSGSKVWANRYGPLSEFLLWVRAIAKKLANDAAVTTGSGLDRLAAARRVTSFPGKIVAADLPSEAYLRDSTLVTTQDGEAWLIDLAVEVESQDETTVTFRLHNGTVAARFTLDLRGCPLFFPADKSSGAATISDEHGGHEQSLVGYLNDNPVVFYLETLAALRGDQLQEPPTTSGIALQIDPHDWDTLDVDPFTEKPPSPRAGKQSLFEYVEKHLANIAAEVVFLDDAANEIADIIALREENGRVLVQLFHCKAASGKTVPNKQIEDLYEVVCQAVKCRRWLDARRLGEQIEHREKSTKKSRFLVGTLVRTHELLSDLSRLAFEVVIVQPALSTEPKETIVHLLSAADAYMRGGDQRPLRFWGSRQT